MKRMPLALCLPLLFAPALVYAAGPLTPLGPPAPTMKSLDEVEARIPINSTTFIISAPGSYYLTENRISAPDFVISASDVTLDFNGYRFEGAGGGTGIRAFI